MNIARTEVGFAHSAGNMAAYDASGQTKRKRNRLGSEHAEPDICDECTAQGWIGLKEEFVSGFQYPPHHPQCVCDVEVEVAPEGTATEMATSV